MKWLGALLGAIAGPVIVVAVFAMLYDPPGHDNWDFVTPVLLLAAIVVGLLVGAGGGLALGERLREGRPRAAVNTGLATAGGIVSLPLAVLIGFPLYFALAGDTEFVPADEDTRAEWAERQLAHYRDNGLNFEATWAGLRLAEEVEKCVASRRNPDVELVFLTDECASLRKSWYGLTPDSLAALGAYTLADEGWRWEETGERVIVFPDPLLRMAGPVYQMMPPFVLRGEHRDAPMYASDSGVLRGVAIRNCFVEATLALKREGRWDGDGNALPPLLAAREPAPGCPRVRAEMTILSHWELLLLDWDYPRFPVQYWASDTVTDTPFALSFNHDGEKYMVDEHGGWHMSTEYPATLRDPAPPECLFDLSLPCN